MFEMSSEKTSNIEDFRGRVINGDCLLVMKSMPSNSVDTVITDPPQPYGLSFMGKKWDYDVPDIKVWKECLRITKPGGTALIFAGSRTQHRMACAVEDAGFILKDCIMWLYGSGFPKATDISKQLDKGHKRKVVGKQKLQGTARRMKGGNYGDFSGPDTADEINITEPATPEAKLWNGWKSHGLKPAYEPIIVAMKPNDGTYANNALKHGVSGLNIDGGRVGVDDNEKESFAKEWDREQSDKQSKTSTYLAPKEQKKDLNEFRPQGRFPANIILDEEAGKMLDEQSGETKTNPMGNNNNAQSTGCFGVGSVTEKAQRADKGGASRFFYVAKASKSERNMGCEELPIKQTIGGGGTNNTEDDVCGKYGSIKSEGHNFHPTVKPLKLMEYLCILTKTPTGGIVLDPFVGSGTTCMACKRTGRPFIGIEQDKEYCKIAEARIKAVQVDNKLF